MKVIRLGFSSGRPASLSMQQPSQSTAMGIITFNGEETGARCERNITN